MIPQTTLLGGQGWFFVQAMETSLADRTAGHGSMGEGMKAMAVSTQPPGGSQALMVLLK